MDDQLQHTLLELFRQVCREPDRMPEISPDAWAEGSQEWLLLTALREMLVSVQENTSGHRRGEEQLREREELYRAIFEATSDSLIITDLNLRITEVNPSACQLYGYPYEELIGMDLAELLHPEVRWIVPGDRRQVREERARFKTLGRRKDGSKIALEALSRRFLFQGRVHYLTLARNLTEQAEAQQLLEQRVEERTRELSTLLEISHNVASTIELKPLLSLILDQLKSAVDYTTCTILTRADEQFVLVDKRGPDPVRQAWPGNVSISAMGAIWELLARQEPVIVSDIAAQTPLAEAARAWLGTYLAGNLSTLRSWLLLPLVLKEQVVGILTISFRAPDYYTARHAALAMTIANQAAVAIENARLYEQAQEVAALEERQRLARELHDSVSQALYGIALGAHTARALLTRNPDKTAEPLDYVLSQAEAALIEMRALIFELRPETLANEGLIAALARQATALRARHGLTVWEELDDEPNISLKIKQELYRISQEALHNITKHAHAQHVYLQLSVNAHGLVLQIQDDGIGFETTQTFPGHLGLRSIHERVARLGGQVDIQSAPGQGTALRVQLPGYSRPVSRKG